METIVIDSDSKLYRLATLGGYWSYSERDTCTFYRHVMTGIFICLCMAICSIALLILYGYSTWTLIRSIIVGNPLGNNSSSDGFAILGILFNSGLLITVLALIWHYWLESVWSKWVDRYQEYEWARQQKRNSRQKPEPKPKTLNPTLELIKAYFGKYCKPIHINWK